MEREDEVAHSLNGLAARQDALAAAWIALAIAVCRANPRAQTKIEQLALAWSERRAQALEAQGFPSPSSHMQSQFEVLPQEVRTQLRADAKR